MKFITRDRSTGAITLDLSNHRITKFLGMVSITGGNPGSVVVPGSSADGDIWFYLQKVEVFPLNEGGGITISGNTISWPSLPNSILIIGRY